MTYLKQLQNKLQKPWNSGAVLLDEYNESSSYPRKIPLSPPLKEEIAGTPNMLEEFRKDLSALKSFCDRFNYEINHETKTLYTYGRQRLPQAVFVPSARHHAKAINHEDEFLAFQEVFRMVEEQLPGTRDYFLRSWRWTRNNPVAAKKLIASVQWRCTNPDLRCYVRQAQSINVDTKFLETGNIQSRFLELLNRVMEPRWLEDHQSLPWPESGGFLSRDTTRIRIRYLDPKDSPFPGCITDMELLEKDLGESLMTKVRNIIVIENNTTVESLPEIPQTLIVYGRGKGIAPYDLSIFERRGKKLYYFGDIDIDGFSCLSMARESAPSISSVLMDKETFETYAPQLGVSGANIRGLHFPGLTEAELNLAEHLIQKGENGEINRLEQEKLPFETVVSYLSGL